VGNGEYGGVLQRRLEDVSSQRVLEAAVIRQKEDAPFPKGTSID
jgi:hypothetical protein